MIQAAAEKLLALLTYPHPGWLVDIEQRQQQQQQQLNMDPNDRLTLTTEIHHDKLIDRKFEDNKGGEIHENNCETLTMNKNDLFDELDENPTSRQLQMNVLRETCITETVFLIVRLYQTAGLHQKCIELSNLIVDNEYGLFKVGRISFEVK